MMNLAATLHNAARAFAKEPALFDGDDAVTSFGEWSSRVGRLAAALRHDLGCERASRVAIVMGNRPDYLTILYACWHAGICAVPINAKLHPNELAYMFERADIAVAFADNDVRSRWEDVSPGCETLTTIIDVDERPLDSLLAREAAAMHAAGGDDPAWLFFTSGTTGRPKAAVLTHRNLMAMSMSYFADYGALAPGDKIIHAAPLSHGSGLYALPFTMKAASHVVPASRKFDPDEMISLINRHGRITAFLAPTMVKRLINAESIGDLNRDALTQIIYGGAPMFLDDVYETLRILGPKIAQLYGQGEAPMTISYLSCEAHRQAARDHDDAMLCSAGITRTGVEIEIVDRDGNLMAPGEIGEITVRGDVVMAGYLNDDKATRNTIRDGWLWTGDTGYIDERGLLTLKGRSKEVIISGGSNIYPREVEEALIEHKAVLEAAVLGIPHDEWGEAVVAFVQCRPGAAVDEASLGEYCTEHIARFKRPKKIYFLDDIPKNAAGKIDKLMLRERYGPQAEEEISA